MNILSPTAQENVEQALLSEGLVTEAQLDNIKEKAAQSHQPMFTMLLSEGHITDEQLTKALAVVSKVP